jgi:hypothetical protein
MNTRYCLIFTLCLIQVCNQIAKGDEPVRIAGNDLQYVLVAVQQFKVDQPKARLKNFVLELNKRGQSVEIVFVPKPIFGPVYHLGGGNEYGNEVHYLVSRKSLQIVRTTWAR